MTVHIYEQVLAMHPDTEQQAAANSARPLHIPFAAVMHFAAFEHARKTARRPGVNRAGMGDISDPGRRDDLPAADGTVLGQQLAQQGEVTGAGADPACHPWRT